MYVCTKPNHNKTRNDKKKDLRHELSAVSAGSPGSIKSHFDCIQVNLADVSAQLTCKVSPMSLEELDSVLQRKIAETPLVVKPVKRINP